MKPTTFNPLSFLSLLGMACACSKSNMAPVTTADEEPPPMCWGITTSGATNDEETTDHAAVDDESQGHASITEDELDIILDNIFDGSNDVSDSPKGTEDDPLIITIAEVYLLVPVDDALKADLSLIPSTDNPICVEIDDMEQWVVPIIDFYEPTIMHIHDPEYGLCPQSCTEVTIGHTLAGSAVLEHEDFAVELDTNLMAQDIQGLPVEINPEMEMEPEDCESREDCSSAYWSNYDCEDVPMEAPYYIGYQQVLHPDNLDKIDPGLLDWVLWPDNVPQGYPDEYLPWYNEL